tara:strand:- start:355 stop:1221 length:867 start_codon:yes stop_codon:yes gene_type:complete
MKKFFFLIPVYNDWDSLKELLKNINIQIQSIKNVEFNCLVINDCSTVVLEGFKKPNNFNHFKIIDLKKNIGHARCNAVGLRHLVNNEKFDHVIVMDGDGEDRPEEIRDLLNKSIEFENKSVVARRIKRSEGLFFKLLYEIHKTLTLLFTGKKIYFGNFSCLTFQDVKVLSNSSTTWSSFSGSIKKNISNLSEIKSIRGIRYFGPSKMSLFKLVIHSLAIMASFKFLVLIRSIILLFLTLILKDFIGFIWILIILFLVLFNFLIFLISKREKIEDLVSAETNISVIKPF